MVKNIKTFYWNYLNNFGDKLNELILPKVFNINPIWTRQSTCNLIAIGSILDTVLTDKRNIKTFYRKHFLPSVDILGSGFIDYHNPKDYFLRRKIKIHALRGNLSKNNLEEIIQKDINVPVGDFGLLCNKIKKYAQAEKKYKIGFIPHFLMNSYEYFLELQKEFDQSIIISLKDSPEKVINQILSCEIIISEALHGLIVADSFLIPNIRIKFNNAHLSDFKFEDYYSIYENEILPPITNKNSKIDLNFIKNNYFLTKNILNNIEQKLINSYKRN